MSDLVNDCTFESDCNKAYDFYRNMFDFFTDVCESGTFDLRSLAGLAIALPLFERGCCVSWNARRKLAF